MSESERLIYDQIMQAEDRMITTNSMPCIFYGERIVRKVTYSLSMGYSAVEDYEWTETYNIDGVMGGYSCTNIFQSIAKDV
jgi:hypothetical protein